MREPGITVITAAISGRETMLQRAISSVNAQTTLPTDHIILYDHNRNGCFPTHNKLLRMVKTTHVQFLNDDNFLYPHHIATITPFLKEHDLIYCYHDISGRDITFNYPYTPARIKKHNFINEPCIRMSVFDELGYFGTSDCLEDWRFYIKMTISGKKFHCVEQKTFKFFYGHGNYSLGNLVK